MNDGTHEEDTGNRVTPKVFTNIFSLGDVCLTRANEEKSIVPINMLSSIVANNIVLLSKKQREAKD